MTTGGSAMPVWTSDAAIHFPRDFDSPMQVPSGTPSSALRTVAVPETLSESSKIDGKESPSNVIGQDPENQRRVVKHRVARRTESSGAPPNRIVVPFP